MGYPRIGKTWRISMTESGDTKAREAARRLAAMGGSVPDFPDIPRRKATRVIASSVRQFMEEEIKGTVRQMRINGATLDDIEAELFILADSVRAQAEGLRAEWPDMMRDTIWGLEHPDEC
jgi:hypothetical protein